MWLGVVAITIVLHDTPPPKTGAQVNKQDVTHVESKRDGQAVTPQPTERKVPAPKPVPKTNREIGQSMAAAKGWKGNQWLCLEKLWTNESNWRTNAANRSSGAHGIPQSLPASKMRSHGDDYLTNPSVQIAWGLDYIANRYGTPCNALSFWNSKSPHWY